MSSLYLLKLICLIVFLGWMLIWILIPTDVYKSKWTPKLSEKFNATYIGGQGINLFLLTFPIMLISVLGCIYIHIKNRTELSDTSCTSKNHLAFIKRPLLVLGPLGVVNTKELIFAIMGITLMSWQFGNYFYVSVKHPHMGTGVFFRWQRRFRSVSLRLGYASNVAWAFVFFPVTRLSSILPLVGLTYESSIKYHIWVGQVVMVLSALHSLGFFIYWLMTNQMLEALEWSPTYVSNLSGEISWVFLLVIWVTSFAYTRRKTFEVFFYTHQLYALATFFYVVHIGVSWTCQILPGIFLFTLDRYLRFLQSRSNARLISARLLPGGTVEMTFHKSPGVHYGVTSTLFVNAPKISKLQWHPFTVISNENLEPDTLSIAFNSGGSWTEKIHKQLSSSLDRLQVSVEGPYEPASTSFLERDSLVLISGGSGVTPYISIIREIIHRSNTHKGHVPRVQLICAFKHASDLTMLDLLLPVDNTISDLSKIKLEIQVYITRESKPPTADSQKLVQTKWFKPSPQDVPITPVLGQNGWLLLSFIITSSFILFFLILALVTQYHIYPIDHNTNNTYNFTIWVIWDCFIMCISIIFVGSVSFLWQKSKMTENQKQITNMEVPSPLNSPGSWFGGGTTELESLPYQSLVQATQVHYEGRPNLQKILSGCKGSDIGVIASGPRGMRHDVARICSCFGSKKLHYEYLSFTW
ncbi:ferric reduction oxidase 4-like [Silene latifolia]|uniref:ferric reduction oxidase 4-like n=1 Tax=Silene latifolia TaxID=37657 RepID=UPI003D76FEFA